MTRGVVVAEPDGTFTVTLENGVEVGGWLFEEHAVAELARLQGRAR